VRAPIIDALGELPYSAVASIHSEPEGPVPVQDGCVRLRELPPQAVEALLAAAGPGSGNTLTVVELRHLGGALGRPPAVPNAVAGRDAQFQVFAVGVGEGPAVAGLTADLDRLCAGLEPWRLEQGSLNYLSARDGAAGRVGSTFGAEAYERLLTLKATIDPENTFRVNHNIAVPTSH
jgi:hypothetical protein